MKQLLFLLLIVPPFITTNGQTKIQDTPNHKNTIALLGMYHFDNPNQDHFNVNSDNILSEKRQLEIEQLVARLATYKPTHIALEFNANDTAMDGRYQRYLNGKHTLDNSEPEQIGFRLAKMLGHSHIYPVDAPGIRLDFDPGTLANEYGDLLEQLGKTGDSVMTQVNGWVKSYTVSEILSRLNSPEMDKLNVQLYYSYILPVGNIKEHPGLEAVTKWYKRNLLMLHHIMKIPRGKNEQRLLVILGQGHTAMLKQFLNYSAEFDIVDIQQFLGR